MITGLTIPHSPNSNAKTGDDDGDSQHSKGNVMTARTSFLQPWRLGALIRGLIGEPLKSRSDSCWSTGTATDEWVRVCVMSMMRMSTWAVIKLPNMRLTHPTVNTCQTGFFCVRYSFHNLKACAPRCCSYSFAVPLTSKRADVLKTVQLWSSSKDFPLRFVHNIYPRRGHWPI